MNTATAGSVALPIDNEQKTALTILYGSQTGNGQGVAEALADLARNSGFSVSLQSLADFRPANLKRERQVVFVVSTHGDGEPPDDAELFHEFLLAGKTGQLPDLKYSVLALGDSSYVNFCQTGREFDARLAELGAARLAPLTECDLDYEHAARSWTGQVMESLPGLLQSKAVPQLRAVDPVATFDRHSPFQAQVLTNQKITGASSTKDVRHIELSLDGSGLRYEPGDSLAVVAENPPRLIAQFVAELNLDPFAAVDAFGRKTVLADALRVDLEITVTNVKFLRAWAEIAGTDELVSLLDPARKEQLSEFIAGHQLIDVVRLYPAEVSAQAFVSSLRKLSPRSYSISSSPVANPGEVHLTVAAVRYEAFGSEHWGSASTYLADWVEEGATVEVFVEPNTRFRLPDDDIPIIMVGPGTGVAPFRAFVEERAERNASGENWLIFGDRNFRSDFLYQLEWQRHLQQGRLQRLDVAFSRDQQDKTYVQQRIRENAAELFAWIQRGAVIYVCGDAEQMAGDVDEALVDVISGQAGVDRNVAMQRLKQLRRDGRYQRDVY